MPLIPPERTKISTPLPDKLSLTKNTCNPLTPQYSTIKSNSFAVSSDK